MNEILESKEETKQHFGKRWKDIAPKREKLVQETQAGDPTFMDSDLKISIEDKFSDLVEEAKKVNEANNPGQSQE